MAKIKPGMLCWLTQCQIPENNGRVVTVQQFYGHISIGAVTTDESWIVKARGPLKGLQKTGLCMATDGSIMVAPWQLIPINDPDSVTDDVTEKEREEV